MRRLSSSLFFAFLSLVNPCQAEPLVLRVKPRSVERQGSRTLTEDAGVQASRLRGNLAAVNAAGKGVDCPPDQARPLPDTALANAADEPKYADVPTSDGRTAKISVVPKSMLPKIYEVMHEVNRTSIDLKWKNACLCQERAHVVGDRLAQKLNLETGKLMASVRFGPMAGPLTVTLPEGRRVDWSKHVTNFVMVEETPGQPPVPYALDPALFPKGAVPLATWRKALPTLGDDSWADLAQSKPRLRMTNRYTYAPEDAASYVDAYPDIMGKDPRNLSKTQVRLDDNKDLSKCLRGP